MKELACFPNSWHPQGGTATQQWESLAPTWNLLPFIVRVALNCRY